MVDAGVRLTRSTDMPAMIARSSVEEKIVAARHARSGSLSVVGPSVGSVGLLLGRARRYPRDRTYGVPVVSA